MSKKVPEVGKKVIVYDPVLDKELSGVVNWCGSIQFTYFPDGETRIPRFAFYANKWRYADGAE